ncbi:MAG: F0F1 ATP synthase subunit delta [Stackebrandtia sp.]
MSGAEREAVAAGVAALTAHAGRVQPEQLLADAAQLLSVRDFFAGEPRLRRTLTDPARGADDRAGLATQVLSGKVSDGVLEITVVLTKQRWTFPSELLTGLETVAVDALLIAGRAQGVLDEVEDELFRFGRIVDGDSELSAALSSSGTSAKARAELVRGLLSGKAGEITVQLAAMAASGFAGRGFDTALRRLLELSADKRDESIAYVTTATALPEDQEARLGARLSEIYGRSVSTKITVDPQVVGGIKVQIGHDLYDGTVARRLSEARKALAARR